MKLLATLCEDGTTLKLKKVNKHLVIGQEIEINVDREQPRKTPQHRRYWARLQNVCGSLSEETQALFYHKLIEDFARFGSGIDIATLHQLTKKLQDVSTINFYEMSQEEAVDFYIKADVFFDRWLNY